MKLRWFNYLLASLACYSALLWRIGYHFGDGDQEEVLGQILHAQGSEALGADFLIASTGGAWTVRTAFVELMSISGESTLPLAFFILHALIYLAAFWMIIRIGEKFISSRLNYGLPLVVVFAFYAHSPGANDLYSAHFISESIGLFFALVGIYLVVARRYSILPLALLLSTLFHPLVGIQSVVLLVVFWLANDPTSIRNKASVLALVSSIIGVSALAGFFVLRSSTSTTASYFDLMFRFRNPHHYLPSQFPLGDLLLLIAMISFSIWILRKQKGVVAWFVATAVGMLVYWLGVEALESEVIAKTQWFKTSIWVRLWFGVALITLLKHNRVDLPHRWTTSTMIVLTMVSLGLFWMRPGPFNYSNTSDPDLVEIGHEFRQLVGEEEHLVVQPIHITGFQYASHAPLFVSFKSILHYPKFMDEWYSRLGLIYGDFDLSKSGFLQFSAANGFYHDMSKSRLAAMRSAGITHILATSELALKEPELVLQRGAYFIYDIK